MSESKKDKGAYRLVITNNATGEVEFDVNSDCIYGAAHDMDKPERTVGIILQGCPLKVTAQAYNTLKDVKRALRDKFDGLDILATLIGLGTSSGDNDCDCGNCKCKKEAK